MRALALGGGGVKGAYQIGVIKGLIGSSKVDHDIICGVSVGALHVAMLSQVNRNEPLAAVRYLEDSWRECVNTKTVYARWRPFGVVHGLWRASLYDSKPLHDLLNGFFDPEIAKVCGRSLAVGAVNVRTGKTFYARESHTEFMNFVLASASFPVFFPPVRIENDLWFDGGVKEVTPLGQAIKMGAKEIDLIVTDSDIYGNKEMTNDRSKAFTSMLSRTIELMHHRMLKRELEVTNLKNALSNVMNGYRSVKVNVHRPSRKLTERSLDFDPVLIDEMVHLGYEDYLSSLRNR